MPITNHRPPKSTGRKRRTKGKRTIENPIAPTVYVNEPQMLNLNA